MNQHRGTLCPILRGAVVATVAAMASTLARADSVVWLPDANGDWDDATNWSSGPNLPDAGSDVTIAPPDRINVALSYDSVAVHSLTIADGFLTLNNATLSVATTLQLNGNAYLSLINTTLQNTVVSVPLTAGIQLQDATLANDTLSGTNVQSMGTLHLSGAIINNAMVSADSVAVSDTTTLNGNGTLALYSPLTGTTSSAVLNIGPAQTVQIEASTPLPISPSTTAARS